MLEFADLLTEPNAEAVRYDADAGMGMLKRLCFGSRCRSFPRKAFREASRQHRSAMEGAVSAAPEALAHAEKFIAGSERDASDCRQMDAGGKSLGLFPV